MTTAPYTYTWTNVVAGTYSLSAIATDDQNASTTSAPITVTVNSNMAQAYYIHTDHLDTPRLITDTAGNVVWQWDNNDPFGNNPPDENPGGAGQFSFPLRFPGQYADQETDTYYNFYRDHYFPDLGRYGQSDPIGLNGGQFSTYAYVNGNPLSFYDPFGLKSYIIVQSTGTGGIFYLSGEAGVIFLIDPCTFDVHNFSYKAGGIGLGFGGAVTLEIGGVDLDSPRDIEGWGLAAGGFATAIHGLTGQISGPSNFSGNYLAGTGGYAAGAGAGISGLLTKTNYLGTDKFSSLPQAVQDALGTIKPECDDNCKK